MKRNICIVLAILTLMLGAAAAAEPAAIDVGALSDDELIGLLDSVQQELVTRGIGRSAELINGSYTAGRDLPAGKYDVHAEYDGSMWLSVYVYNQGNKDDVKYEMLVVSESTYGGGPQDLHIVLEEGDLLECSGKITLTISAGVLFK